MKESEQPFNPNNNETKGPIVTVADYAMRLMIVASLGIAALGTKAELDRVSQGNFGEIAPPYSRTISLRLQSGTLNGHSQDISNIIIAAGGLAAAGVGEVVRRTQLSVLSQMAKGNKTTTTPLG